MDWKECCDERIAKEVKPDLFMVKSLLKSSENKLKSEDMLEMNNTTAVSKLSLAYDSLRELLEALALKRCYKIYNHECYSAFLKEIVKERKLGDEFDNIRKIRNAANYYGKDITIEKTTETIKKIKVLRNSLLEIMNK